MVKQITESKAMANNTNLKKMCKDHKLLVDAGGYAKPYQLWQRLMKYINRRKTNMTFVQKVFPVLASIIICHSAFAGSQITPKFPTAAATLNAFRPLAIMQKDKFETSADFTKRLCDKVEKAINTKFGSVADFAIFETTVEPYYDADKHAFILNVGNGFPGAYDLSLDKYLGIKLASSMRNKSSYVGQNVFGASKNIAVIEEDEVTLLIPARNRDPAYSINTRLPVKLDEARRLDKDLRVIISTKVQSPCFVTGTYHRTPEINYPEDRTSKLFGIIGSRDASWKIIRGSTGEILKTGRF